MPPNSKPAAAIEVDRLIKRFPHAERNALDDISFDVRSGETFGLLGPNGAGKSTAIGILTTMIRPSGGRATITGIDVVADPISAKQRIAVVPQRNNLDRTLRVGEILTFHAAYHGVPRSERGPRAQALLEEFGLSKRSREKLGWFSGGMEQRLMLARALMTDPLVLFLDEPTNNLDPQSRLFLWERMRALHDRGVTMVLTTHDMHEADRLCQRIAILDQGRILALETPEELKRIIPGGTILDIRVALAEHANAIAGLRAEDAPVGRHGPTTLVEMLGQLAGVRKVEAAPQPAGDGEARQELTFRIFADVDPGLVVANVVQAVMESEGRLLDLRFAQPSLEDVFIYLTGKELRA